MRNIFLTILFLICIISCRKSNNEIRLKEENALSLKEILDCDKINLSKNKNYYILDVNGSRLKTDLGKEMASSNSALIVYNEIVDANTTLNYNTLFKIDFSDSDSSYSYTLQDLSDALEGQLTIENMINQLKDKNVSLTFKSNDITRILKDTEFDWTEAKDYGIGGFQILNKGIESNLDAIRYSFFILPQNIHFNFYFDRKTKKIIKVER